MNIYQRMSAITTELSAVAKNLQVGEGRNSYKAVGEADVLAAVKPLEAKHGIYSYPLSRKVIAADVLTTTKTYNGQTTEQQKIFIRLETVYRFVNVEDPGECLDIATFGDGIDSADKAPGKAMTYCDKYALLKAYKIITGDDPDQNSSEDVSIVSRMLKQKSGKQVRQQKTSEAPAAQEPPEPAEMWCSECGTEITDTILRTGVVAPAAQVLDISKRRFGRALCAGCMKSIEQKNKEAESNA